MKKWSESFAAAVTAIFLFTGCAGSADENASETSANSADDVPDVSYTEISSSDSETVGKNDLTFPIGRAMSGGSFTGTAYIAPLIANDDTFNFPQTNNVTFEPGARSGWHTH